MNNVKFQYFVFTENKKRNNTYDIEKEGKTSKNVLSFVRLSEPREDYLIQRGAELVMQSFKGNKKILHTGLVPFFDNYYFGDILKENNKKDFIIAFIDWENRKIHLYIIANRNPRNKEDFAFQFLKNLAGQNKLPN